MAKTVVGSFDSFDEAQRVVSQLKTLGVDSGDVSVVAHDTNGAHSSRLSGASSDDTGNSTGGDIAAGALTGGVVGGTAGLLAGLAGLAIPGVGPLVAAGPIAAALAGAGVGAVAGGLIGGLRHVGVDEHDAEYYAEAVRRGGALVTVRAEDAQAQQIADVMRDHGAVDIQGRVAQWKQSGWTGFDANAQPLSHDDIQRERATYRTSTTGGSSMGGSTVGGSAAAGGMAGAVTTPSGATYGGSTVGVPMTGQSTTAGSTVGGGLQRAGDAIERAIPGDSDRDGK